MFRYACIMVIMGLPLSVANEQPDKGTGAAPQALLIYYGWPSLINGANGNLTNAANEFAKYDFVVIGGGLQDAKHQDHKSTRQVIALAKKTQFFGYIPLGNRKGKDQYLPLKEITKQIADWAAMGVKGVLLDEFGYDYGVSRERQNDCVVAAHAKDLRVIANAWNPDDVFLPNGKGVNSAMKKSDIYLWERYRFSNGDAVSLDDWRKKADKVSAGRKDLPLSVFSVSTNVKQPSNAAELFAHQWFCAAIDGHVATGWGHPNYCGDTKAPLVPVPAKKPPISLGELTGAPVVTGTVVTARTTYGEIRVDAKKLDGAFQPNKNNHPLHWGDDAA